MLNVALNEIVVMPVSSANTALGLSTALYNIESNNTIELRSQSVSTSTGNEHTVVKTANESVIATKVPAGELALLDTSATNLRQDSALLARVIFL